MATEQKEEILDLPEGRNSRGYIVWLYTISAMFLAYWYIASWLHWPWQGEALLIGLVILVVVLLLRFLKRSRRLYEYFYLVGKCVLIAGIFFHFMRLEGTWYFIIAAFAAFSGGLLALTFGKSEVN